MAKSKITPNNCDVFATLFGPTNSDRGQPDLALDALVPLAAAYQHQDESIAAHIRRVAGYVRLIAEGLGLSDDQVLLYQHASTFHDVGMVDVPSEVLLKNGPLNAEELEKMRRHTEVGHRLLATSKSPLMQVAALIARFHHESFDGSGYPLGLKGEAIPMPARITTLADVFDALTTKRPFKEPYPFHVALDIIEGVAGRQFDPRLVATLTQAFREARNTSRLQAREQPTTPAPSLPSAPPQPIPLHPWDGAEAPSFNLSLRDRTNKEVFSLVQSGYFSCPYCKSLHPHAIRVCPTEAMPLREIHKLSGRVLNDKYLLQRAAGAGGMAAVYEAWHLRIERRLAIKILDPQLANNPADLTRFFEEARIFATVGHPNLVEVLDFDLMEQSIPFIVMEFLDGADLAKVLSDRGKLDLLTALTISMELLRTLEAVHAKGIVHRDIKPENIYFINNFARLKLLDFGISLLRTPEGRRRRITEEGRFVGTPEYMSPEQALGADVDHRSDLFTVGEILYEMLTGHIAFDGDNPMAIMMAVSSTRYTPAQHHLPSLPTALIAILDKALARQPEDRFQSAAEFSDALSKVANQDERHRAAQIFWP